MALFTFAKQRDASVLTHSADLYGYGLDVRVSLLSVSVPETKRVELRLLYGQNVETIIHRWPETHEQVPNADTFQSFFY